MSYAADQAPVWPVPPDWNKGVLERLAWLTDMLQARNGVAQKRELRLAPRRGFVFEVLADGQGRRVADALLFDQGGKLWDLPIWHDIQLLDLPAGVGEDFVQCRTDGFEFVAGGRALIWRDVNQFEVVNIGDIEADRINLDSVLVNSWAAGSRLYPLRYSRNLETSEENIWTDQAGSRKITFLVDEPCDWPAVAPAVTYRDQPVLEHRGEESDDPTVGYSRQLESVDADSGPVVYYDYVDAPFRSGSHTWLLHGRTEHAAFRSLLYALRGQAGIIWLPSMAADLVLKAPVSAAATTISVEWCGYTLYGRQQPNRRDVRIELRTGLVLYRRITGSVEAGALETLTLDVSLGVDVTPAQVLLISFMTLSEPAADSFELDHLTDADGLTRSAIAFRAVKNVI